MQNKQESAAVFTTPSVVDKEYILNTRLRKYKQAEIYFAENIINIKEAGYPILKEDYLYACEVMREESGESKWDFLMW